MALAETAFAGGLGMTLDLGPLAGREGLAPDALLFSETPSRLAVTVAPEHRAAFEAALAGVACHLLGEVTGEAAFRIAGGDGAPWIEAPLAALKAAWQETLKDF